MAHYIDADRLKEQIQGLINLGYDKLQGNLYQVLNLIDSLQQEQPEFNIPSAGSGAWGTTPPKFKLDVKLANVDLEQTIHEKVVELHTAPSYDELRFFALYFYELGLNARKEDK